MRIALRRSWRALALAGLLHAFAGIPAGAQAIGSPQAVEAEAPAPPLSPETRAARARLDALKLDLDQKEAALRRPDLPDAELQALRTGLDPVADQIRTLLDELAPRLEAARARLDQLGPKPKEDAPPEGEDVARDRAERESAVAEVDDTLRLARALQVQTDQLTALVSDRRRASFTRALFERSSGVLSPDLWRAVWNGLPREARSVGFVLGEWFERIARNARPGALILLGLAIGVSLALFAGRRYIAPRLVARDPDLVDPPRRRVARASLGTLLVDALPAAAGSYLVYFALDSTGMTTPRMQPVLAALLAGVAGIAALRALANALLAPAAGAAWRLVPVSDAGAARLTAFATLLAVVVATGKVVEAVHGAAAAPLVMTVATRGAFALLAALLMAELLRRFAVTATPEEACLGPYIPTETDVGGPAVRVLGWTMVAAIAAAALLGYAAFASFLVDQTLWIAVLAGLLHLALVLGDEFIAGTFRGGTGLSTALQANTGLRRRSLEQIGILASGVARLALVLVAVFLALAPWGVDGTDLVSYLRGAVFGFKVGDVTISLATIAAALLVFAGGFVATRIVQSWLDTTFLPATDLDAGIRNSISTAFGYLGVFAALALGFAYLGLSLEKIAIVAGALSVGIGFGLQSIVNNFVSGLILLWERPIRVGDLVVVGDGEGYVQKISVRATEIRTFDRSTIIVPNSNLISGVVRNRVRGDRTGRVIVTVNVLRNQDPVRAAELLLACAREHRDVVREPPPRVVFKKIGDATLEFDLVAFVADVNVQLTVLSDLNFAVFARLTEAGMIPPVGPGAVEVMGLGPVETALEHIAGALGAGERGASGPGPAARAQSGPALGVRD